MSQDRVRAAFEIALGAWAQAQSPAVPIAWENVSFTPPAPTQRFAEAFLLPARTVSETLDGAHRRYTGLFQVNLVMPLGAGSAEGEALLRSLDAAFPLSTQLVFGGLRITLTQPMSAAPALARAESNVVPVSCSYRADDD